MIRFGLCCQFKAVPIKFFTTTATSILKMDRQAALDKLSMLCLKNAHSLYQALEYCSQHQIGAFRVNSQILPLKTHPVAGYDIKDLPEHKDIIQAFKKCKVFVDDNRVRISFHPDQFILLSSPNEGVTERSIADLEYQAQVSEWVGADVINIHGGGAYGDKPAALQRVIDNVGRLSKRVRSRLTFENDDKIYSPQELMPVCQQTQIPLVYDVHHHRCCPDEWSIEEATQQALSTWNREPLFHISSPKEGWDGPKPSRHHDYIDVIDFPKCWKKLDVTIDIEAKAKEQAIFRLAQDLNLKTD